MSGRDSLDLILDRCVEEIRAGRMTVSDCLARYPEHRAALEPVLRAAADLATLPRGEERAPSAAQRRALMAAIRQTPQQPARGRWGWPRVPSLGSAFRLAAPVMAAAVLALVFVLGGDRTPAAASTLTVFDGQVEQYRDGQWLPLADGERVAVGTRVRTGPAGQAVITLPDGSTLSLDPSSEVRVARLEQHPRRVEVEQASGRVWHDVVHDTSPGASFVVRTADARVEVLGTVFETAIEDGLTTVSTADGEVVVVSGGRTVPVARGEAVRARSAAIESIDAAPLLDGAIRLSGPFAAAIVESNGRATGVRPDGVVFRQVRGITMTEPEGLLQFDLHDVQPGSYALMLARYGDGAGSVEIETAAGVQRFAVTDAAPVQRIDLRFGVRQGVATVEATSPVSVGPERTIPSRVVESDRTRDAVDLASAAKTRPSKPSPTVRPTSTPTPQSGATRTPQDVDRQSYTQRLRFALAAGRPDDLAVVLSEALAATGSQREAWLAVLGSTLENPTAADRVALLLTLRGETPATLLSALSAYPEAQASLEKAMRRAAERDRERRPEHPSTDRTPQPQRTPTPTPRSERGEQRSEQSGERDPRLTPPLAPAR